MDGFDSLDGFGEFDAPDAFDASGAPHAPDAFDELGRLAELALHTAPYDGPPDHESPDLDAHELDAHDFDAYDFAPYDFANCPENHEESDVLRRAFMTGGPAALAASSVGGAAPHASAATRRRVRPVSPHAEDPEARAVESAVRQIRVLDDRHGGAGLYRRAGESLRAAYELLDAGTRRQSVSDRLHAGAGELAISVGWLAHDSGRYHDARSHYAEALATSRVAGDAALEAHAFCNTAFLARDAGRPREAVRAAQAGQQAAGQLGSHHLMSLLALREAGGWAGLGDRRGCQQALARAHRLFAQGPGDADPEWMSFFGEAELEGLEAQCWSALGLWERAAEHAQRAVALQDPHFTRNRALFTAELAGDLAAQGQAEEAAAAGSRALDFLGPVQSTRISSMLETAAGRLRSFRREPAVAGFLARQAATA
ncbi:tetratricopeptide repeat protein [Streptomyces axinellae]|uniref:tetratricopeptide repeat protein n=1 Tax=Streptomyces axinellae TaxID=552788 RepID=UPI003CD09FE8